MKRVLVIGGTRFFGRLIVGALIEAGHHVTVLTRGMRACAIPGASPLYCDRKDKAALSEALAGKEFDAVIDNVCYDPADARSILDLLTGRCGRYVLTSSVMSYLDGLCQGRPVVESEWGDWETGDNLCPPYAPQEVGYALGKRACEKEVLARADLEPLIFRLHNVVGVDDFSGKSGALVREIAEKGLVRLRPKANDSYQFVHAADLAALYLEAVAGTVPSGAYNVASPPISVGEFAAMAAAAACGPIPELGCEETSQGAYPSNVLLDAGLLRRSFRTCLADPGDFLPAVFRWYAAAEAVP